MSATLKDVARNAGVSIVTASRVFNGNESVKPAFKKKVFDAAKALNYTPNLLARGLAKSNLKLVSVCVSELENPFFGSLAANLAKEFSNLSYNMIICDTVGKTLELNRSLATSGSVLVSIGNKDFLDKISRLQPVVGISCKINENHRMPNIKIDFSETYTRLFEKAVYSDKDKIAFYSHLLKDYPVLLEDKFTHVQAAMRQKGLSPVGNRIFDDIDTITAYINGSPGSINCIFCENDMAAAQLHGRLVRRGFRIPEDIIVIGCDGTLVLDGMWSVSIDTGKIAARTAELFKEYVANGNCSGTHLVNTEPIFN